MSIRVTCPGCHTRFEVSDQFAGKEGPCPKCKKPIQIPSKDEEVVIHAPDGFGPKGAAGRAVLKPIFRSDSKITPLGLTLAIVPIATLLILALVGNVAFPDREGGIWYVLMGAGAFFTAIPCVLGAYQVLRDQDRGVFDGKELWLRVLICASIYAALWFAMPLAAYAFNEYGMFSWLTAFVAMFALGAAVGMYTFELDYLLGLLHVGWFIGCCLLMRFCAGIGFLPGAQTESASSPYDNVEPEGSSESVSLLFESIQCWLG